MTVAELIEKVEGLGYGMVGNRNGVPELGAQVIAAPVVVVPKEPPVKEDCKFIVNFVTREKWEELDGARLDFGVATDTGVAIHLVFQRKEKHGSQSGGAKG